ncbi:MAG TPA: Gfo/Idh/MocA family oxidoreductase, partial [Candidatus Limnocylindria bacterium]|nr:Gfo/Idh/MocA family oxidoreductase [Candidatus Limnocylindria bacterium]
DQALRALRNGKAVFMEKPMLTDFEQFSRMKEFLATHPMIPFCVDYNRSFAPFIQKIKQEVVHRSSPLIVHYRMNAGFIPKEHWIQTDVGAGRIIGEACHIFDLFCFLTDSKPVSVSVEALHAKQDTIFPTDNFSAQIGFADGSLCTLLYTSLGHAQLGKERMELFYDSKSIVMDDYEYLVGHGLPKSFEESVASADKGHTQLLNLFFHQLQQSVFKPPIPLERLYNVAAITLIIDQLACEGGGTREIKTT